MLHLNLNDPHIMTTLDQSDKLELSTLFRHEDDAGMEPLPPSPLFDYNAYRDKIQGYAPPTPRSYSPAYDMEEAPDISEDEDEETLNALLTAFCVSKQGHETSGDILPSMRSRGAISAELRSMGCAWND